MVGCCDRDPAIRYPHGFRDLIGRDSQHIASRCSRVRLFENSDCFADPCAAELVLHSFHDLVVTADVCVVAREMRMLLKNKRQPFPCVSKVEVKGIQVLEMVAEELTKRARRSVRPADGQGLVCHPSDPFVGPDTGLVSSYAFEGYQHFPGHREPPHFMNAVCGCNGNGSDGVVPPST